MGRKRKTTDTTKEIKLPASIARDIEGLRSRINVFKGKTITNLQFNQIQYLMYQVIKITQDLGLKADEYVHLHSSVLIDKIGSNYSKYLDLLQDLQIIESLKDQKGREKYSVKSNQSKSYRFCNPYRTEELTSVTITVKNLLLKESPQIEKVTIKQLSNPNTPEFDNFRNNLFKLCIHEKEAIAFVESLKDTMVMNSKGELKPFTGNRYQKYKQAIHDIAKGNLNIKLASNGRIISSFSKTPSLLRQFLYIEGYTGNLIYADLSSSQLVMMVPMLLKFKETLPNKDIITDIDDFIYLIQTKDFYKQLVKHLEFEDKISEESAKEVFFEQVLFKDETKSKRIPAFRKMFNKLFPNVNQFLLETKKDSETKKGNSIFSNKLTKLESKLFNNIISRRIFKELGKDTMLLNIYDGLWFKEDDADIILNIMEEEVSKYSSLSGMFKIKKYYSDPNQYTDISGNKAVAETMTENQQDIQELKDIAAEATIPAIFEEITPVSEEARIEELYKGKLDQLSMEEQSELNLKKYFINLVKKDIRKTEAEKQKELQELYNDIEDILNGKSFFHNTSNSSNDEYILPF